MILKMILKLSFVFILSLATFQINKKSALEKGL